MRAGLAGLAVAVAITAAGAVGLPVPAAADSCGAASGVSVVVDFGSLGGGAQAGCAPGDPTSGLAALQSAGFGYSFVPSRPGFVCRVNGLPEPCNGAPAHAYWSYWYAQPGGSWTYSNLGAASRDPAPGSVEGWAFGDGDAPGVPPPQTTHPDPAPSPAPTPTLAPGPAPTQPNPVQPVPTQPSATPPDPNPVAPTPTTVPAAAGLATTASPTSATGGGSPSAGATGVPPGQAAAGGGMSPPPSDAMAAGAAGSDAISSIPAETSNPGDLRIATSPVAASGDGDDDGSGSSAGRWGGLALVAMVGAGAIGASRRRMRDSAPRT